MKTTITTNGRLTLPRALRRKDGIAAGQTFRVTRIGAGEYRLNREAKTNKGLVAKLLACPYKGWFRPIRSELTDTL